jgi:hypothetical protein
MKANVYNVTDIASDQRQTLERLLGRALGDDQQVIIHVVDREMGDSSSPSDNHAANPQRPAREIAPTLPDWCRVYEGLSDQEIEELEDVVLARANLSRPSD